MPLTRSPATQTRIAIDQAILDQLDEIRPLYMDRTTFINFQLDSSLRLGARPAGAGSLSSVVNKEEDDRAREELINRPPTPAAKAPKDPFTKRNLSLDLVPEDLTQVADALLDFWSVKKGTRSERAWKRLCDKLRGWSPADQEKALAAAYDAGWATVYEPKPDAPTQGKWEPSSKHPAHQVFTAEAFDTEKGPESPFS